MPGFTTPDGFIFDVPGDQPGTSTSGGQFGTFPIAQEQIQQKFNSVAVTTGDLADRLTVVEAALADIRWRHITSGQGGAGPKILAVPAGFERLRLTVTGDLLEEGTVLLRVNGDSSGSNHVTGRVAWDSVSPTPNVQDVDWAQDTAWDLVQWSTVESNNTVVDIFPTDGRANPSFVAHGGRIGSGSGGAEGHTIDFATGKYLGDVVVSSLELFISTAGTNNFAAVSWWLEGYLS